MPHLAVFSPGAFQEADWTANNAPKSIHQYDALRRTVRRDNPDGTTYRTWLHVDRSTIAIDERNNRLEHLQDGLGRLTQAVAYDAGLTVLNRTSYAHNTADQLTGVTSHNGYPTTIGYDLLGRKNRLVDPDMGTWTYEYDARGNMTAQTDARGTLLRFGYDALNRLVSRQGQRRWTQDVVAGVSRVRVYDVTELRAAVDANRAAWGQSGAAWSDAQVVAGQTRVRAVHFNEIKDRISDLRVTAGLAALPSPTGDWPVGTTKRIRAQHMLDLRNWLSQFETDASLGALTQYGYDAGGAAAFALGRRTSMADGSGSTTWTYDPLGRVTSETRTTDGASYRTDYAYDALDRLRALTYPDDGGVREVLTHGYGADGRLASIVSSLGPTYLSGAQYDALGQPTSLVLGSGTTATETRAYSSAAGTPYGALSSVLLQQGANAALVHRSLLYDAVGNVTQDWDKVADERRVSVYDALDRLTSATLYQGATQTVLSQETFAYDPEGNLTSKNGVALAYNDAAHRHAVSSYNGNAYSYDADGNLTSRGGYTFAYDAENRLARVDVGGSTVSRYAYDGDGVRTKRLDADGTVHYAAGGLFEKNLGGGSKPAGVTKLYRAQLGRHSRLIAFRRAGTLYYAGVDHLGGTVRVADSAFPASSQMRYSSYGQHRDTAGLVQTDRLFTGQTWDALTGLYFYGSRYYDAETGRFAQPDSIVPGGANPQALNRYSYVLNNPLKHVDPSGHIALLAIGVGALVGGVVGGVGYVAGSWFTGHQMTLEEAAVAIGVAAASGALAPVLATGYVGAVLLGAGSNIVQYAGTEAVNQQTLTPELDPVKAALAAGTGAAGGAIAGPISRASVQAMAGDAERRILIPPRGREFDAELVYQARMEYVWEQAESLPRAFTGAVVSNTDPDEARRRYLPTTAAEAPGEQITLFSDPRVTW